MIRLQISIQNLLILLVLQDTNVLNLYLKICVKTLKNNVQRVLEDVTIMLLQESAFKELEPNREPNRELKAR